MANLKSKHAFGSEKNIQSALDKGLIDAYDILFLEEGKIGWVDKDGNPVIAETDLSGIETDISSLEAKVATKANVEEVDAKIKSVKQDAVSSANAYTDGKIEAAVNEHLLKKYEISHKPEGALVNYGEKEIRVMCPVDTKWVKQNVGATGNANMYYMGFKAYAPEGAVSFKEGDRGVIIDKMFTFDDDFAGTDEYGRNYSICWLALASYDPNSNTWTYFGKNSTINKYIGWTYIVEWYDANGVMIATDSVRINLSNEECHSSIEPYYVSNVIETAKSYTDSQIKTKIAEIESAYEVIEF